MSTLLSIKRPVFKEEEFAEHLAHIKKSKEQATKIMDVYTPGYSTAEAVLSLAWQAVFDHFCEHAQQTQDFTLGDINTLSAIIHKLMSSFQQITKVETSVKDLILKETVFHKKQSQEQGTGANTHTQYSFTEEEIKAFEKQFHLL